jgi:SOUL heme-binding protein
MKRRQALLAAAATATGLSPLHASAIEEPTYTVVRKLGEDVELRDYNPYVVAEVTVPGPADEAGGQAFPILAGYIFGKNKGERKMAMTAPVTQAPAQPQRMAMTAPVTQAPAGAGEAGFVVQFVLPGSVSLDTAPEPLDARIRLRDVPAVRLAAIRYSGLWSQANQAEHTGKLQAALQAAGVAWTGEPVLSRYNGPLTPWFMRRNEIWLALK